MPRVTLNKKKYMLQDMAGWIAKKMFLKGLKQKDLGNILGISQPAACKRLDGAREEGKDNFSAGDMITLFKELEDTDEEILAMMKL